MHIAKFSVKNPVLVNLVLVSLLVLGTVSLIDLPRDLTPNINFHWLIVVTTYSGVNPEEIEKLITIPLEDAINNVDNIKMVTSSSTEGVSQISVQFENMSDEKYDKLFQDLKSEIEKVDNLPEDIEEPEYVELTTDFMLPMLFVIISGTLPEIEMKEIAEDLQRDILDIKHIARAELGGVRERQVRVEVDPERLSSYGLTLNQVVNSIAMKNLNIPGGTMNVGRSEYILRTIGEINRIEELSNVIIRKSVSGGRVAVKDVAAVLDTLEDAKTMGRLNGKTAITLIISKKQEGNIIELVKEVRKVVEQKQAELPENITISFSNDMAVPVGDIIGVLESNALMGLVMVLIVLWLFLGWRNALFVGIGIPVTFMATFIFLRITGNSLNGSSLFGLVLVLGIIVDDAIIVVENCYRYVQKGYTPYKAAIIGTKEVTLPVLAATGTTVAAFLPLMFVPGIMGEFFKIMPIVVSLALLASLVEAFFILPSHVAEWSPPAQKSDERRKKVFDRLRKGYRKILTRMLRRRHFYVGGVTMLFFICVVLVFVYTGVDMFAGDEIPQFFVFVTMPEGTTLEETDRIIKQLEERASKLPESDVKSIVTNTGMMQTESAWYLKPSVGQVTIELVDSKFRERRVDSYIEELRERAADISGIKSIDFSEVMTGPPVGPPVEIKVRGDDYDKLQLIANEVKNALGKIDGVSDIKDDFDIGKKELRLKINEERAALYGLDIFQVASTVRTAFEGTVASKFRELDEEIDIIVKYKENSRSSFKDLENMKIAAPFGQMVSLKDIAEYTIEPVYTAINRTDRIRAVTVIADVDKAMTNSNTVNKKIMEEFADIGARYPGYSLKFGGEFSELSESMEGLWKLFILGVFLIYVILGGQFSSLIQPFMILYTIPFAFIGAIAGLLIINSPFSLNTMYGIVALAGIVVNDALVLISFLNNARQEGYGRWRSIILAGSVRLRPIILTSVTTIFGLLPMAIGLGGKSETWGPLAATIVGGLFFSTVFTLFIVPCLIAGVDDFRLFFGVKSLKPRPHLDEIEE